MTHIHKQVLVWDDDGHPYVVIKDLIGKFLDSLEDYENTCGVFEDNGVKFDVENFRICTSDLSGLLVFSDSYIDWLEKELCRLYEIESMYDGLCK